MPNPSSPLLVARPGWTETFMRVAEVMALRGTCPRLRAGAVVATRDNQILSSGYNGAPQGAPHCDDVGCLIEGGHCVRSAHAEANAIYQAARVGTPLHGAVLYSLYRPCIRCAVAIVRSGIAAVWYKHPYDSDSMRAEATNLFSRAGIFCDTIASGGGE